jgi:hypothetical protein
MIPNSRARRNRGGWGSRMNFLSSLLRVLQYRSLIHLHGVKEGISFLHISHAILAYVFNKLFRK